MMNKVMMAAPLLAALSAHGNVLFVDDDAPAGGDGTSWTSALRFMQDALALAGEPGNGITEIRVAGGTYQPDRTTQSPDGTGDRTASFELLTGVAVRGGYGGLSSADPDARDPDLFETVLTGDLAGDDGPAFANDDENSYHVVIASGVEASAVIEGLTIQSGNADGTENPICFGGANHGAACGDAAECPEGHCVSPNALGAGIYVLNGRPTITDCRIIGNFAAFQGAGILLKVESHAIITDCSFEGNHAIDNGGAMYLGLSSPQVTSCEFVNNRGGNYAGATCNRDNSNAVFVDCLFHDNTAAEHGLTGGGAVVNASSSPIFINCVFSENRSILGNGGAMYNKMGFNADLGGSHPILQDCLFEINEAFNNGGGLYNIQGSNPQLSGCTFVENTAVKFGGAVYNTDGSTATFDGCLIERNIGERGAGMYNIDSAPTLTGCDFVENFGTLNPFGVYGGGLYNQDSDAVLTDCSFVGNVGRYGGGVYNLSSDAVFTACTFQSNVAETVGGAVYSTRLGRPILRDCVFEGNTAPVAPAMFAGDDATLEGCSLTNNVAVYDGGAIYINMSTPTLVHCALSFNSAGRSGGAIHGHDASPTIIGCKFTDNDGGEQGGAMTFVAGSEPVIVNCLMRDNTAALGGALHVEEAAPRVINTTMAGNTAATSGGAVSAVLGDLAMRNCVLSGNAAADHGGGLHLNRSCPRLVNCALSSNDAGEDGGGVYGDFQSNPIVTNSILWGNTDAGPTDQSAQIFHGTGNSPIITYSCVQGWTGDLGGEGNTDADPLLTNAHGSDGIPGTEDDNLRLRPGSPAIDAANTIALSPCDVDLDGRDRFVDDPATSDTGPETEAPADLGPFEFASSLPDDCNDNGVPDLCDAIEAFSAQSPELAPFGAGEPQAFTVDAPPQALGVSYVRLRFRSRGDYNAQNESVDVRINGAPIGTLFVTAASDCPETPDVAELQLDPGHYNELVDGGDATITMSPSNAVETEGCESFIAVAVEYYMADPVEDANADGLPDSCQHLGDLDGDGLVGTLDLLEMLAAWGPCPPQSCPADLDGDARVGTTDLLILLANWTA